MAARRCVLVAAALIVIAAAAWTQPAQAQNYTINDLLDLPTDAGIVFPVCPDSSWRDLTPHIRWRNISDIHNWTGPDFWDYVGGSVIPRSAASITFLALAVCMAIGFVVWRIVRCSMQCCCQKCIGTGVAHEVCGSKTMFWLKVVAFVCVLGIIGTGIAGLVLSFPDDGDSNIVEEGFIVTRNLIDYVDNATKAVDNVTAALYNGSETTNQMYDVFEVTGDNEVTSALSQSSTAMGEVADNMAPVSDTLDENIVQRYDNAYQDQYDNIIDIWNIFVLGLRIAFGVAMGFGLIMMAAMYFNWGWGIATMIVLCLLVTFLFTVLAAGVGVLLVMISDACPSAEGIIINLVPDDVKGLVRYYLNIDSNPTLMETVAAASDFLNSTLIEDVEVTVREYLDVVEAEKPVLYSLFPDEFPQEVQQEITSLSDLVYYTVSLLLERMAAALIWLSLLGIQGAYRQTKTYVCCSLPETATIIWSTSTAMAWFLIILVGMAFGAMALLDRLPASGKCCSCACVPSKMSLPDAGKAVSETEPSAAAGGASSLKYSTAYDMPPGSSMPSVAPQPMYGAPVVVPPGEDAAAVASVYPPVPRA